MEFKKLSVLSSLVVGCAVYGDLKQLPERPRKPHAYYDLRGGDVEIEVSGREKPIRIHYKEAGSGPPLLLVHGLMTSSYSFRYLVPLLAGNYRVLIPDLPGAGKSDAPTDLKMSPQNIAALLEGFLRAVNASPAYVVGNSLGGYESLWLAVLYPTAVQRLMVMHAPGIPECRLRLLHFALSFPGGETLFRGIVQKNPEAFVVKNVHYFDDTLKSLEEAREYGAIFHDAARTRVFQRILKESFHIGTMKALHRRLAEMQGANARERLPPIRLLWSRKDVMVPPRFGDRYKALLPDAELVWLDDTSHFMHVDSPERTAAEIKRFDPPTSAEL